MERARVVLMMILGLVAMYFLTSKGCGQATSFPGHDYTPPTAEERGGPAVYSNISTEGLTARISTYSGAIDRLSLTNAQFYDADHPGQPMDLVSTTREQYLPLRANIVFERGGTNVLPRFLTFRVASQTPQQVDLVAEPPNSDVVIHRIFTPGPAYSVRVRTEVTNRGAPGRLRFSEGVFHSVDRAQESGGFFRQPYQVSEGLCQYTTLRRGTREELSKNAPERDAIASNARYVGINNLYFLLALVPEGNDGAVCHLRAEDRGGRADQPATGSLFHAQLSWRPVELGTNASHSHQVLGYFGPKLTDVLKAADPSLTSAVNLGFFAFIARGLLKLLQLLYSFSHNWGLAIILLTVIVRVALYPLLARGMRSMAVMQKIKPEIDDLNARFAEDQNAKGLAMMELYRKHGVNPLSGCLPQLAQLPVWWALYTTLQTSVELFHAPFMLFWRDLSAPDPFHIGPIPFPLLPLILGAVMFVQQRLMPPSMPDPVQAKIMLYFMPIFLTAISLFLPAGLALYMLVNSLLAMVQQRVVKIQIDRMVAATDVSGSSGIEVRPAPVSNPELGPKKVDRVVAETPKTANQEPKRLAIDLAVIERARVFLEGTLARMGLRTEVAVHREELEIVLEVCGPDAPLVIGKKGATIDALQALCNRVARKGPRDGHMPIVLDADGYRERREQSLTRMARRLGEQVRKQGTVITLDPLSARDRRVIHMALARFPGVMTKSEGEGVERRLQIIPMPERG